MANIEKNRYNHVDAVRAGNSVTVPGANCPQPPSTFDTGFRDVVVNTLGLLSNGQKWWMAIMLGIVFALLSLPFMYIVLDYLFCPLFGKIYKGGGPSLAGILLNTIIFILVVRLLLI